MINKNTQNNNVCLFVTAKQEQLNEDLGIINLVYEKHPPLKESFTIGAVFKLCVVTSGEGVFKTLRKSYKLKRGDIFLISPSMKHSISSTSNLNYMYIKFSSTYAYKLVEQFRLNKINCYFENFEYIINVWENAFKGNLTNVTLIASGLVFLTLPNLQLPTYKNQTKNKTELKVENIINIIKDNYCESSFNLEKLARLLFYNKKYLSDLFKKKFNVTFTAYLTELRLNNAINLINSGFTSIKEIAQLSGFSDALYFSKIFKKNTGLPPIKFIEKEQSKINN